MFTLYIEWNVLCFILCWNWPFLAGQINFEAGLGLALVAVSIEPMFAARSRWMAYMAQFLAACVIILVHPFGGMFYFVVLTGLAAGSRFENFLTRTTLRSALTRAVDRGWPAILALAVIIILGRSVPSCPSLQIRNAT